MAAVLIPTRVASGYRLEAIRQNSLLAGLLTEERNWALLGAHPGWRWVHGLSRGGEGLLGSSQMPTAYCPASMRACKPVLLEAHVPAARLQWSGNEPGSQ